MHIGLKIKRSAPYNKLHPRLAKVFEQKKKKRSLQIFDN